MSRAEHPSPHGSILEGGAVEGGEAREGTARGEEEGHPGQGEEPRSGVEAKPTREWARDALEEKGCLPQIEFHTVRSLPPLQFSVLYCSVL